MERSWNRNETEKDTFDETWEKLSRYCLFLTKDRWDGEDIAQEAILKAVNKYGIKNGMRPALLKKIAYHLWIDQVRKKEKESIGLRTSIEQEAEGHQEIGGDAIEQLITRLTPKQLISFVLKEAFQYKNSEIAAYLDMSETAVKGLLNRARTRLKMLAHVQTPEALWTREYHEKVCQILITSLTDQDPSILIQSIPALVPSAPGSTPVLSLAA
ncbi:sigma factor-like helix-turn-helix DNA-binding protein [Halobacillus sp. A5]|uniref:sigma factor-like helix-turn-helix DNA-binding protein n=1 Tax=Halobacillus sp. A5 TaxID=2880263 RepID=UPI0020A6D243